MLRELVCRSVLSHSCCEGVFIDYSPAICPGLEDRGSDIWLKNKPLEDRKVSTFIPGDEFEGADCLHHRG
jgi:hypothetical protein